MSVTPCVKNDDLKRLIDDYADSMKTDAHKIGAHGLTETDFYNSGLFRGAIERIRGQFSATMREKREFVLCVLNYMQDRAFIRDWDSAGESNRHDYVIHMNTGRVVVVELKGCLDGNNTNIFARPDNAHEFYIWSVCTNPGADPQHNSWSGIHVRLSAEIIERQQRVDGVVIWDMVCGTIGRPCPKVADAHERITEVAHYRLPPPCIYAMPGTVPSTRNNPRPLAQELETLSFLTALHECFNGKPEEVNYVDFEVEHRDADTVRKTRVRRGGQVVRESAFTPIRRS